MPILFLLKIAFSLRMLTDAIKRGAPTWWYFLLFFPLGAVAYFLVVNVHDFGPAARVMLRDALLASRAESRRTASAG